MNVCIRVAIVVVHECNTDARRNHHHRTEQTGREHHGVFTRAHQPENQHETKRHRTQAHQMLAQSDTQRQIPTIRQPLPAQCRRSRAWHLGSAAPPISLLRHGEGDEQAEHRILQAKSNGLPEVARSYGTSAISASNSSCTPYATRLRVCWKPCTSSHA